jgi:polyisoprenoid-binding protein YceI
MERRTCAVGVWIQERKMNRNHRFAISVGIPVLLALLVLGCANPADDKPEAAVGEAEPVPAPAESGESYAVDVERSTLGFVGSKITGSHDGGFNAFEGVIELVNDDPTASSVMVRIDTTSLWSDDDRLTKHLKSPDFFDVETFPESVFESTSIEAAEGGYTVTGNLTLHGVTKSISFPAQIEVGPDSVTAQAEFFVKRFDFDIVYPGKPDDLIRDEVVIKFDLVGAREAGPEQGA